MRNLLLKINVLNDNNAGKILIDSLNKVILEYDYSHSRAISVNRKICFQSYSHRSMPTNLAFFDYKGIKFNMISCPAGGEVDVKSLGTYKIQEPFMLGETEVTQELFESVMGFNYSVFRDTNKPVERVSWYDCLDFCNKLSDYFNLECCYILADKKFSTRSTISLPVSPFPLSIREAKVTFIKWANGFRLPREWEWMIAAMAETNNQYSGANDVEALKDVAWFPPNANEESHPVAQKKPNEWGFYDMSGNVWEWCENSYEPGVNNNSSVARVMRGGSWNYDSSNLCSNYRGFNNPSLREDNLGFRIAKTI